MTIAKVIISNVADLAAVILMVCQLIRIRKMSAEKGSVRHYFRILSRMVSYRPPAFSGSAMK